MPSNLLPSLRAAFAARNSIECESLLVSLKLHFALNPPSTIVQQAEHLEMLEIGAMIALHLGDLAGFERHAVQAQSVYRTLNASLSERAAVITGLYLLMLLSMGRTGEFHTELECLSSATKGHQAVQYALGLEKAIMEGNLSSLQAPLPYPEFGVFVSPLGEALKTRRATSIETASAPVHKVAVYLKEEALESFDKLLSYAAELERIV